MSCPCGEGPELSECCQPFLSGDAMPETAEQLMRSRYTAYTQQAIDYVVDSHDPGSRDEVDRDGAKQWAEQAEWLGLEVVDRIDGQATDDSGVVEFKARYRLEGAEYLHHERATFKRIDGRWYYQDGEMIKQKPVVRETPKVGRNEPCPCGSGKKFKKCCGA